jgi:hypothetical protein
MERHTVLPFVGIVVKSAIGISVAFQLFGYAKGIVGAAKVLPAFVAVVAADQSRSFHFRPHGPEASTARHFIRRCKPETIK